jgi:5'-methylthioadenosine phosphorylase
MSYVTLAMVTDYDCWHPEHDAVTVETVISYLNQNARNARQIAIEAVKNVPRDQPSPYASALRNAIISDRSKISDAARQKYGLLVGKYFK